MEQISESDYKIRNVERKKKLQVLHFDRLKLCTPGTRFSSGATETVESSDRTTENSNITLHQIFLDKIWNLLKVDQDHLSHIIQEEREILLIIMHVLLLTRIYKFGTNSYAEKGNVTSVNDCAIHYCNDCITTNLAVETHCVTQYYTNV